MSDKPHDDSVLRYGIIGAGMMGREHIRNLLAVDGTRITALADPDAGSITTALDDVAGNPTFSRGVGLADDGSSHRGQAGDPPAVFATADELLASGLCDAVVIATPNVTHAGILERIFDTYPATHVLCEKPMCTTIDDAERIHRLARDHQGVVHVGLEYRYMPPIARFLDETSANVGDLRMLAIREHRFPFLPKVGDWNRFSINTGGTLVEKCCHFFDLMNLVAHRARPGDRPIRVMASGGQAVNHLDERYPDNAAGTVPDILDHAYVIVEYASGLRTMLDLCMFAEASVDEQELVATGSAGKVEAFIPSGTVRVGVRAPLRNGYPQTPRRHVVDAANDDRVRHGGFHHGSSYLEHLAFVDAIRNETPAAVTTEDGMWSVAVGVAAHQSIETGLPVVLAQLSPTFAVR